MNRTTLSSAQVRFSRSYGRAMALIGTALLCASNASAQTFLRTHIGSTENESLGSSVAGIGDIDGDSVPDYAVGSPYFDDTALEEGRVTVFSGATGTVLQTLPGGLSGLALGTSMAGLGDISGDGVPDFVVGGPTHGANPLFARTRVYSGADFSQLHEWISTTMDDSFGEKVGNAGDVNGDGIVDIAVYAPTDNAPGVNGHRGKIYLYSGANYQLLWSMLGAHMGGPEIGGISAMGDTNGDGLHDLLMWGSNHANATSLTIGRATIVSGFDGSILRSWEGNSSDTFGHTASSVGDVTGDGIREVAMVSRFEYAPSSYHYGLWLFSGGDGQVLAHEANLPDPLSAASFRGMPDLTGDGVPNIITKVLAFPAKLQVRSASDLRILYEIQPEGVGDHSMSWPSHLGDVNGDGISDWVAGAPLQGSPPFIYRGHVYVVSGADPLGTAYCTMPVPNSSGRVAWLTAAGSNQLGSDWLSLRVQGLPQNEFGFFLCSTTQGFFPAIGGSQGNLCLGGALGRFNGADEIRFSGSQGAASMEVHWTNLPQPTGRVSAAVGETWNFQMWYRDLAGASNFSNGMSVLVQ
ncbi:MAG: integrin alpha [Planctomycetota bacterium]|nr:integrin alpha [Planctomycetota bacterium]